MCVWVSSFHARHTCPPNIKASVMHIITPQKSHKIQISDIFCCGHFDPSWSMCSFTESRCFPERHVCAGGTWLHRHYLTPDFPFLCTPTFLSSFEEQPNPTEKCRQIQITAKNFLLCSSQHAVILKFNSPDFFLTSSTPSILPMVKMTFTQDWRNTFHKCNFGLLWIIQSA